MRVSNVDSARVVQVLEVKSVFGRGTKDNMARTVTEYYSLSGELLARVDPCAAPAPPPPPEKIDGVEILTPEGK